MPDLAGHCVEPLDLIGSLDVRQRHTGVTALADALDRHRDDQPIIDFPTPLGGWASRGRDRHHPAPPELKARR